MPNNFENFGNAVKQVAKKITKAILIHALPIVLIVLGIFVLLASIIDFITQNDGEYRENDWSSTPYAGEQYTDNVTINDDGTATTSMTAQELWDEMIINGSRVDEYLDSPEELLKLMNAELVTNYPDTRPNPNEPIDWETINSDINSKEVQGIIKFNRARDNGANQLLTFVDEDTFYSWVEQYVTTGNLEARENALTHFTINSNSNMVYEFSEEDLTTDISNAIVQSSYNTPTTAAGLCQAWVRQVYENAGLTLKERILFGI